VNSLHTVTIQASSLHQMSTRRTRRPTKKNARSTKWVSTGPFRSPAALAGDKIYDFPLYYADNTLDSTGAGVINDVIPLFDPTNASDYGVLASSYREFRVVAARLRYIPHNRYSKTTTVTTALMGVIDVGGVSVLTGYNQAYGFDTSKALSLDDPWSMTYRLPRADTKYSDFEPTSAVTAKVGGFKLFASALSLSVTYGTYVVDWKVQVRGRK